MKKKLVFVCLGNICRSPAAEGVMKSYLEKAGLLSDVFVDSAGTSGYHDGEPADSRMISHAKARRINLTSKSRQFVFNDFKEFDYIIVMDKNNYKDVLSLDGENKYKDKVILFCDLVSGKEGKDVPDPYYKGADGFEEVLDLVEQGCKILLDKIKSEI